MSAPVSNTCQKYGGSSSSQEAAMPASVEGAAVIVSNACKKYAGSKLILDHLNMNIARGSIYGLLGASGCGKTTLLSCIAGRLKLNKGDVYVLGGVPGTRGSGVPGPRVGYMPQEVALVSEMSIENTIYYFGWMFAMTKQQIAARLDFLAKLLELHPVDRLVRDLSGGQQRRVSFAAALVQTPELLILDEPTVGLDPVLRQSIWDYLVCVSRESAMTVIITTHYIEEATQADKVGLMRNGRLLAEEAPAQLIARCGCETLEQVFLRLSQLQEDDYQQRGGRPPDRVEDVSIAASVDGHRKVKYATPTPTPTSKNRLKALLYKDMLSFVRNTAGLAFLFFFPLIQMCTFFIAVGNDGSGLTLGVVNDEMINCSATIGELRQTSAVFVDISQACHFYGLSCLLLDKIDDGTIINVAYSDVATAMTAARRLRTMGTLHIPANFSQLMEMRRTSAARVTDEVLSNGEISVWLDMSNYVLGYQMKKHLYDKYAELVYDLTVGCNVSRLEMKIPISFETPVLGSNELTFRAFMAPGIINTIAFFLSAMVTGTILTNDKHNGVWDRNYVAGVTTVEVLLSHCLCQLVPLVLQVGEMFLIGFYMFGMQCAGNVVYVLLLVGLQYAAGMTYGLLVSGISRNTTEAMYMAIGSFLPFIFMSGTLWPLDGAPAVLQFISYCTPATWSTVALFNVLVRGWSFLHPQVWPGFAVSISWIVGQFWVTLLLLRR